MKVPSFDSYSFNPLQTNEAQERFIDSQLSRFGLKPGDISACSFMNGDFKIFISTEKKAIINRIIEKVYGTSREKYLGLLAEHYWGETSIIVK